MATQIVSRTRTLTTIATANRLLLQADDAIDADDHRDPRQTEQWLPVPVADPDRDDYGDDDEEMFRRLDELARDADERGVLNYYNINRGRRAPYFDRNHVEPAVEMTKADICNVEFLNMGDLDSVLGDVVEAAEAQLEMEYLNCRWNVAPKPKRTRGKRDVVPFRSKWK